MAFHRLVFAIAELDDAGNLHKIDARPIVERAGDRRAGDDQDLEAPEILNQGMCDRAAAAQVTKAESVVAVHEDPRIFETPQHGQTLPSFGQGAGKGRRRAKPLYLDTVVAAAGMRPR